MLNTRAIAELSAGLREGRLRAGQFLSMPQLVEILGLPLAAVREATRHGGASGWLEIVPKRGVQILEVRPDVIRHSLDLRMVLDQEGARRCVQDPKALAALPALRAAHEAMATDAGGPVTPQLSPRAIGVDLSLHDFLAKGLDNPYLRDSYDNNRIRLAIIQHVRPFVQERIRSAMEEHLAIIDRLEQRDAEGAIAAIAHHCDRTKHWWGVSDGALARA